MSLFAVIAAAILQVVDPAQAFARHEPFTIQVNHPVGVEASSLARSIEAGGLIVPKTYDGDLLVMGDVVSLKRVGSIDIAVLETGKSTNYLTAYIIANPHLKVSESVGIACHKANGNARSAEVSECKLVAAPGMPATSMTITPEK